MRLLFLSLLLTLSAIAQTDVNKLKIIPSSTGTAVGEIDFQSKDNNHHIGIASPDVLTGNHLFRLPPFDVTGGGCWNTDGSYNTSISSCGGANSISVSPTNPLYLNVHFRDDKVAMYADLSRDLQHWTPLSKRSLYSTTNVRDVSVMYDGTTFWFICSAEGVEQSDGTYRAYEPQLWSTTDFVHFTVRQRIDLSSFVTTASLAGAPEWYYPKNTGDKMGFWVHAGTTLGPWFFEFNPATDCTSGCVPTAGHAITLNGTTAVGLGHPNNTFDYAPYYDPGSNKYYIVYVDFADGSSPAQRLAYATSSTQFGTYTQQHGVFSVPGTGDWFNMTAYTGSIYQTAGAEGPGVIPIPDSLAKYGIDGCVQVYADTWSFQFGAGIPQIDSSGNNVYPGIGNRIYEWRHVDTCPATTGGDPFAVVEPSYATVNVFGTKVVLQSGPSFSYFNIGQSISLNGHSYTIASIPNPNLILLSTPIADINGTGFYNLQLPTNSATTANISNSEQGTIIAITDEASANILYKAADYWRDDSFQQSRMVIGGDGTLTFPYTVTAFSMGAVYGFSNGDSPTIAAGIVDQQALYGPASFALLSACGIDDGACPQPRAGEATWVARYAKASVVDENGLPTIMRFDNAVSDLGEASIGFSNGVTVFNGSAPVVSGSLGRKSLWKVGENNQFFGSIANGGNAANNWFYIYNSGLGPIFPITGVVNPTIANPGFEGGGTGSLSSWSTSGTVTASNAQAHSGSYSAALAPGSSITRNITGLTARHMYVITVWTKSTAGSTTGANFSVSFIGGGHLITSNCGTTGGINSCLSIGSWYQFGDQFATDSSGSITITIAHPFGSGTTYVDDLQVYALESPAGSFALGISPSSGEVRANYGITLGNGDNSFINTFPSSSIDSPLPGVTNFGDGTLGHRNGTVQLAGIRLGSSVAPDTLLGASGGYEIYQTNATGTWTELLHHANDDNVYLDNYGNAGACLLSSCAPVSGGGHIYLRPNASPMGSIFAQGNLRPFRLSVEPQGVTAFGGAVNSSIASVNGGTLSSANNTEATLGSFGMDVLGNASFLGVHIRRQCLSGVSTCTNWPNAAVGFSYDVDNTFAVGPGATNGGNGIWMNQNGVGINTTLPLYSLDVLGTANVTGTIRSQSQTVPASGAGTEVIYTGGSGFVVAYDRTPAVNNFKDLNIQGATLNLFSSGGGVNITGNTTVSGSINATSGNAGGSITCTFQTITYMTSPTTSASATFCNGLTTNTFSHGIRTN